MTTRRWVAVLVLACGLLAGGCGSPATPTTARYAAPTVLRPARPAPDFTLHDAAGRTVRLSQLRGRAVLLTFVYARCPDVCPLMVGKLRAALARLGPRARGARVVAVSVDPRGDTPALVRAFVARHGMRGRMSYLIGSRAALAPVWKAYGIGVAGTPEQREVGHSALVTGITAAGRLQTLYPPTFSVAAVAHDVPLLAAG